MYLEKNLYSIKYLQLISDKNILNSLFTLLLRNIITKLNVNLAKNIVNLQSSKKVSYTLLLKYGLISCDYPLS